MAGRSRLRLADASFQALGRLLICSGGFATSTAMTVARIIENDRKTTQSGKSRTGKWTLEFEREQPHRLDPLMGWAGSGDTRTQVRMAFDSAEAAIAYARRHGLDYHLVPAPPATMKIQAYADNFR